MLNLVVILKYLSIFELINWLIYLLIYVNILTPRYLYIKNKDTEKIIKRIDKLTKSELEYVIKGCIVYDKNSHEEIIDREKINIKDLTFNEITNIIGYSLFGIEINEIKTHSKYINILKIIKKIENNLEFKFKFNDEDRFIYRKWGSNFIKFSFRPLILQIIIRIIINFIHYYQVLVKKYKYYVCSKTKISYLYKINDPNKQTIFFIHGFGFGYIPYINILNLLEKKYNIIIIILPNISTYRFIDELTSGIFFPSISFIRESVYNFLDEINIKSCIILSHSFGTYVARILELDSRSSVFKNIIMIDPIIFWIGCFKMSLHIDNPLVRKFPLHSWIRDNIVNFLVYKCIYHKYVCLRIMFGPDFWIYNSSELKDSKFVFILEKGDYVVPIDIIYNKIKDRTRCYYIDDDNALHGSILTEHPYIEQLLNIIDDVSNFKKIEK